MAKAKAEPDFTAQEFSVSLNLYPLIAMVPENALKLATELARQNHQLTDIHMGDEEWEFRRPQPKQGQPRGLIKVKVQEQEVTIEHHFPTGGLERFENLVDQVLGCVEEVANPEAFLGSTVSLEYLVDIGVDGHTSILTALQLSSEDDEDAEEGKLAIFERPCQFVGLRLGFPPFFVEKEENGAKAGEDAQPKEAEESEGPDASKEPKGADWHASFTLQSIPDEPTKLSVEVDGHWLKPRPWKNVAKAIIEEIGLVDNFLKSKTKEFLKHFRSEQ